MMRHVYITLLLHREHSASWPAEFDMMKLPAAPAAAAGFAALADISIDSSQLFLTSGSRTPAQRHGGIRWSSCNAAWTSSSDAAMLLLLGRPLAPGLSMHFVVV